jgi:hypothetical protein
MTAILVLSQIVKKTERDRQLMPISLKYYQSFFFYVEDPNYYFVELLSPTVTEYVKLLTFFGRIVSFQFPIAPRTLYVST